jgi:hypothetical protein
MASFDINAVIDTTRTEGGKLAKTLFKKFADQAVDDTKDFLQSAKDGIARAGLLFAEGKIDRDDLEDLILGKRDLAEMHKLKQTGLAKATIDTFVNGVLQILVDAVFAAVKF